ncbi:MULTISPECIES: hypothetical protein [unclassified Spirosoma]|uniref:hypothetical protein n=1 Tax=unclassified Spirosoma TaxID=2621999 RepID=UPI000961952E|nr:MULTISPECIES: hypothetical protein [unclassified Spirosoma]MBN8820774.1 hypothetical protein [Spirosoma sp.]OJW76366.1 MAG: hypothetical protein BGO59_22870 [Spirosoma sp. 48-14]
MKTIQFSIDLRSFFLGALTLTGILLLANFTPSGQPEPGILDTRRFQAVASERESIILDTKTGQFVVLPSYIGQPRRFKYDFNDIEPKGK